MENDPILDKEQLEAVVDELYERSDEAYFELMRRIIEQSSAHTQHNDLL